jgi:hypothetical protein
MSTQVYQGAAKKAAAERALKTKRPVLVLFFMHGCPHCIANQKAWKEAKRTFKGGVLEIDENATPPGEAGQGFPTMQYINEEGRTSTIVGERESGDQILKDLGASQLGGRRHTRRRATHRRNRKLRHRTLRNHVALV